MDPQERKTTSVVADAAAPPAAEAEALPAVDGEQAAQAPRQGVYGRLFREGYAFDFYQAVRLLERCFPDAPPPGETTEYRDERIRIRPDVAPVFPAADVKRVEWHEAPAPRKSQAHLVVSFMGLYGVGSPLPYYFYDHLATQDPSTFALRDFLDLFNHRLYAFFYRAWKKYRPPLEARGNGDDPHARRFLSLAGVGLPGTLREAPVPHPLRLAAFAGRLGPRVRNVEGLKHLLASFLGEARIDIIENVPRWVSIPERAGLGAADGSAFTLGEISTIGERVVDRAGKFRIVLGALSLKTFQAYLPGGTLARRLDFLVRLYAPDYLDYDVELRLPSAEVPPLRLSGEAARLGLTTFLGRPTHAETTRVVRYGENET